VQPDHGSRTGHTPATATIAALTARACE